MSLSRSSFSSLPFMRLLLLLRSARSSGTHAGFVKLLIGTVVQGSEMLNQAQAAPARVLLRLHKAAQRIYYSEPEWSFLCLDGQLIMH
eukprot:1157208-Pelagomonas_calceolata.AAC.8